MGAEVISSRMKRPGSSMCLNASRHGQFCQTQCSMPYQEIFIRRFSTTTLLVLNAKYCVNTVQVLEPRTYLPNEHQNIPPSWKFIVNTCNWLHTTHNVTNCIRDQSLVVWIISPWLSRARKKMLKPACSSATVSTSSQHIHTPTVFLFFETSTWDVPDSYYKIPANFNKI
jgi:hypothetical protein